ncbi:hypothetical protein AN480_28725 (plasmid) [Mycobacterium intracellulare subsp. chimaera]|uniref:DUF6893 family small protein n=1 Tax=Mycobacterium intracellulare TaxID=1767 RepID=UPI00085949A9|nr:hypothetical protein [Mycobacterium intracellulare]AOS95015.1 hypothetical protein AN480_28725 [Mycobacterium intracellulare subsp. chimaera]
METIGRITVGVVITVILAGVVAGVSSIPDVKRYMRIRKMSEQADNGENYIRSLGSRYRQYLPW